MKKSDLFCLMCTQRIETLMQYSVIAEDSFNSELLSICRIVDKVDEFNKSRFIEEERLGLVQEKLTRKHNNTYHAINRKKNNVVIHENQ